MRKTALLFLLTAATAFAPLFGQAPIPGVHVQYVNMAPSGACVDSPPIEVDLGNVYTCGGGGTPGQWGTSGGGGGSSLLSQKVVYASKLSGIPASTAVVPGSSASGTTDSAGDHQRGYFERERGPGSGRRVCPLDLSSRLLEHDHPLHRAAVWIHHAGGLERPCARKRAPGSGYHGQRHRGLSCLQHTWIRTFTYQDASSTTTLPRQSRAMARAAYLT